MNRKKERVRKNDRSCGTVREENQGTRDLDMKQDN